MSITEKFEPIGINADHDKADAFSKRAVDLYINGYFFIECMPHAQSVAVKELFNAYASFKQRYEEASAELKGATEIIKCWGEIIEDEN